MRDKKAEDFTEEMTVTQSYKPDGAPIQPSSLSKNSEGNHLGSSTDSSRYGTDGRTSSKVRGILKANSFGGMTHVSQKQGPYKSYSMNKADSFNCSNSALQLPGVPLLSSSLFSSIQVVTGRDEKFDYRASRLADTANWVATAGGCNNKQEIFKTSNQVAEDLTDVSGALKQLHDASLTSLEGLQIRFNQI